MPKRGERQPWKVRYVWSNGISGVVSFATEDQARSCLAKMNGQENPSSGAVCTATLEHKPS